MSPTEFGNAAILVTFILCAIFLVSYQYLTDGTWTRSRMGRHIGAFVGALGLVAALATAHWAFDLEGSLFNWARAISYGLLPVVVGRQTIMLYRSAWRERDDA